MPNIKTRVLTDSEYQLIIETISTGFTDNSNRQIKPNIRVATALTIQANLGLRIGDIVKLTLSDIIRDGNRYRLNIIEQKTNKKREFTIPTEIYTYLQTYALNNNIKPKQKLIDLSVRQIQKHLKLTCDFLNLSNISTHSFRKFFATSIYNNNGYNVELVRLLLQHSSVTITQRYLGVSDKTVEDALSKHLYLPVQG